MSHKIFISCSHEDKAIAQEISDTLSKVSLEQLKPSFFLDHTEMQPGVWFEKLQAKLQQSQVVIPLLTPNSLTRPWIAFETGFAACQERCEIIPINVGIQQIDVSYPIGMYQVFSITDYDDFCNVIAKVFSIYKIKFEKELFSEFIGKAIGRIINNFQTNENNSGSPERSMYEYFEEMKEHFDKRFLEYERRQLQTLNIDRQTNYQIQLGSYSVPIRLRLGQSESTQYIEIDEYVSIQDVLDNVYRMLSSYVKPFEYLQTWIIRDVKLDRKLIIREVGDCILAKYVFTPDSQWEAIPLERPYSGKDSGDYSRWYTKR